MEKKSIGKEKAIELYNSKWWQAKSAREVSEFQMSTDELCMPFNEFHHCMEISIGRPIFTHEFGLNYEGLYNELFNGSDPSSFEDILKMIPIEKAILVIV